MLKLSSRAELLLEKVFLDESIAEAKALIESECGTNIPGCGHFSSDEMDRIRFSVVKLSEGNMDKLYDAIDLAQTDWRDLLMAAGFGEDIDAHNKWFDYPYRSERLL